METLLTIMTGGLASTAAASEAQKPIYLVRQPAGDSIGLAVIGEASAAYDADFRLEITSDEAAGSNHSVTTGRAKLTPNARVTLVSLTMGPIKSGRWVVRLVVQPKNGASYQLTAESP